MSIKDEYIKHYRDFYNNSGYGNADPVMKEAEEIKKYLQQTGSKTLLDYGSGEGIQYTKHKVNEFWGLDSFYAYDPGVVHNSIKPEGVFDAVINTDVMEHVPVDAVDEVFAEIFSYATKMVYFQIATNLAKAILPNGENAHCTIRKHSWWVDTINKHNTNNIKVVVKTIGQYKGITIL